MRSVFATIELGFFGRVILGEGHKINIFCVEEKTDIFKIHSQSIIGGQGDDKRLFIAQMGFCSHEHRRVRDAAASFARVLPVQGGDEEDIQEALWTDGLCLLNFQDRLIAGKTADSAYKICGAPKTGIRVLHICGKK